MVHFKPYKKKLKIRRLIMKVSIKGMMMILFLLPIILFAEESAPTIESNAQAIADVQTNADYVWTLVAAVLVFIMQAGFAMLETGLTRAKNAVNIIMKNLMDFAMGTIGYWAIGFGLMFGVSATGWFGVDGFFLSDFAKDGDPWTYVFWMFQVVFAATAATIVSGAMAERTKFVGYIAYSIVLTALIYPIFGSWAWGSLYHGSGWLEGLGFIDFAGSTVVHSVGGWAALAGAIVLGPRIGKFTKDGKPKAIPGHNLVLAGLGTFILWFGWFGFNAGSTTAAITDIASIAVTTNLSAAAGAIAAMFTAWISIGKPDASMALNGALAGLVGITAGCANVSPLSAVIIGLIAGVIVVYSVLFIERVLKVDDPVGAVSVHGVVGAWGTLAAGIFDMGGFNLSVIGVQLIGIVAAFLWVFPTAFILFKLIQKTIGLRVSEEEELDGLDIGEHGMEAYPDFEKVV
jgi:Amt family ammonium transporter